jgi:hypothetical protein
VTASTLIGRFQLGSLKVSKNSSLGGAEREGKKTIVFSFSFKGAFVIKMDDFVSSVSVDLL